jgi:hypothetical protein
MQNIINDFQAYPVAGYLKVASVVVAGSIVVAGLCQDVVVIKHAVEVVMDVGISSVGTFMVVRATARVVDQFANAVLGRQNNRA